MKTCTVYVDVEVRCFASDASKNDFTFRALRAPTKFYLQTDEPVSKEMCCEEDKFPIVRTHYRTYANNGEMSKLKEHPWTPLAKESASLS